MLSTGVSLTSSFTVNSSSFEEGVGSVGPIPSGVSFLSVTIGPSFSLAFSLNLTYSADTNGVFDGTGAEEQHSSAEHVLSEHTIDDGFSARSFICSEQSKFEHVTPPRTTSSVSLPVSPSVVSFSVSSIQDCFLVSSSSSVNLTESSK